MLKYKANEEVIERGGCEWQVEDVRLHELHVVEARRLYALRCGGKRVG
jgi:hypothetical protein